MPPILDNISPDGRVLNVSGGTAVMNDLEGYRQISRYVDTGLGARASRWRSFAAITSTEE